MSMKNINDVVDKLEELQGELEDMTDSSFNVNDIAYELMDYAFTSNNSKLKNFIGGFKKMVDMAAELDDKIGELQAVADGLSDGIESETEEQAK